MMRGFNSKKAPEQPTHYLADIPVMGEVILEKVKTEKLIPDLMECHQQLQGIEVNTIFDKLRYRAVERKLERAQHDYAAVSFVCNGSINSARVVALNEVAYIDTANRLIYDTLSPLDSPEMSGRELAQRSMITLYPADTPPDSFEISISA